MKMIRIDLVVLAGVLSLSSLAGRGALDLVLPDFGAGERPGSLPVGLVVNEISIWADGSGVYDREALINGAHYAWSGQIYKVDGTVHCQGGNTWRYPSSVLKREAKTADWLVGDDCSGLTADMTFRFNWASVDGTLADLKFPPEGLGVVLPAQKQTENGEFTK